MFLMENTVSLCNLKLAQSTVDVPFLIILPLHQQRPNNKSSGFLYSAKIRHPVMLKVLQHSVFSCQVCGTSFELWDLFLSQSTMLWFTRRCGPICCKSHQKHRGEPLLFSISALGSYTCKGCSIHGYVSCLRTQVSWLGLEPTLCWVWCSWYHTF